MTTARRLVHEHWGSRTTFVLALSASAVGLGNLWRFSYLVGEHGGGLFVLTYIACLFLIAVPVLIAEVLIGTHGRGSPITAITWACDRSGRSHGWVLAGGLACFTALLITSYYAVIAGWGLAYAQKMQSGVFAGGSAVLVAEHFTAFLADPVQLLYWHALFLLMALAVVALGVRRGLGVLVWLSVPALMVLLAVLVDYSLDYGDMAATQKFLFSVKPMDFGAQSVLVALGQAFYTLGIGVGVGIAYGTYAPDRIPVGRSVVAVAVFDTLIALAAGLAVFPVVFANNVEPSMGPGLMFVSLPHSFANIALGEVYGTLFFALVVLAALGTAVAMLEPVVIWVMERTGLRRLLAVAVVGVVVWVLGVGSVLSFNLWQDATWFGKWNFFQVLEYGTADLLLPLVSLLTAVFVGWRIHRDILRVELYRESGLFFSLWLQSLRYIAPAAIGVILLTALLSQG